MLNVSVIIPTFNSIKTVNRAVDSVINNQEVAEIILVDDGSIDGTIEQCLKLTQRHRKVRFFQHPNNKNFGAGATRNLGIHNAKYDYVAFLDSDDIYLPNRFSRDRKLFENNPSLDICLNSVENVKELVDREEHLSFITIDKKIQQDLFLKSLLNLNKWYGDFHLNGITVKRSFLAKNSINFNPRLRLHQDTLFLIHLVYQGTLEYSEIQQPVSVRFFHGENRISRMKKSKREIIRNRLIFLKELMCWTTKLKLPYYENVRLHYYLYSFKNRVRPLDFLKLLYYYTLYRIRKQ